MSIGVRHELDRICAPFRLDNRLIADTPTIDRTGRVRRRPRLGGVLNFYERVA
jgi:hypothetical protein